MKKIYYIGYYSDPSDMSKRKTAPAADTKMDYIIGDMKKLGYNVEVLSFCGEDERKTIFEKKFGYEIEKSGTHVTFFSNYDSKYRIFRVIGRIFSWYEIKKYLYQNCLKNDCKVVIYHSLGLLKVINLFNKKNKKFVLEMEEIYADVIGKSKIRKKEIKAAHKADAYIFPTQLLDKEINVNFKPSVVVHGTYQVEEQRANKKEYCRLHGWDENKCHVVYAGTFDPRKGGAAAAAAAEFLPDNYHVHILGFGSADEIQKMKEKISYVGRKAKATVTYDGLLSGEEYIQFIQCCDIGLSTQSPEAAFNGTSFPSKILSYLSNGLRVVSIRIPAIENSAIGSYMYYYDKQTPEQISKAILSVDMSKEYDSRKYVEQLSRQFEKELSELLEEY